MYHRSGILAFFIGVMMLMASCEEDPPALSIPPRYDVPVLLGTNVTYYDLQEIRFKLDIAVFKGDNELNEVIEYTGLPDSSFQFEDYVYNGDSVKHFVDKVEYIDSSGFDSFTTLVLIDQSAFPENFDSTDYYNQRFQAFNTFYKNLNGQGKVCFAYYNRRQGDVSVMKVINNELSGEWNEDVARQLLNMTHNQSGSAGLYDALDQAISFIAARGTENKSVTLFLRNKDDGKSNITLNNIILKAQSDNVKINVIWLIKKNHLENVDFNALRQLASRTGGFTVYMGYIFQSSTVFIQLAKLLKLENSFYRVTGRITIPPPSFFNQTRYSTGVYVYYYSSQYFIASWLPLCFEKN
ncbi:MAG: hypothetical protein MUF36_08410 [Bacteroidales bacterium]|jgi:hypothetical protein|nr:hypothetical protein [Bacteroidales bacterium]